MPLLILLNGAPATGKSTLARRYAADHPLALNLDLDLIRGLLGDWRSRAAEAGLAARAIGLAAARTHLRAGHDVVVPQLVARVRFIEELATAAADAGARFVEVMLTVDRAELPHRYAARAETPDEAGFAADRQILDEAQLLAYHDALRQLAASRPGTPTIRTHPGDVERAYQVLVNLLAGTG